MKDDTEQNLSGRGGWPPPSPHPPYQGALRRRFRCPSDDHDHDDGGGDDDHDGGDDHDYYGNDIVKVRGFIPSLARQLLTGLATLLTAGLPLLFFRYPSFLLEHHAP